jgi:hypothetical protein
MPNFGKGPTDVVKTVWTQQPHRLDGIEDDDSGDGQQCPDSRQPHSGRLLRRCATTTAGTITARESQDVPDNIMLRLLQLRLW